MKTHYKHVLAGVLSALILGGCTSVELKRQIAEIGDQANSATTRADAAYELARKAQFAADAAGQETQELEVKHDRDIKNLRDKMRKMKMKRMKMQDKMMKDSMMK